MIFYRRHSVFYRVWLNSKIFKLNTMPFFWPTPFFFTHAHHTKISTHTTHSKILLTHTPPASKFQLMLPTTPASKCYGPMLPKPLTNPRIHATNATHEPTLPMLFSRLIYIVTWQKSIAGWTLLHWHCRLKNLFFLATLKLDMKDSFGYNKKIKSRMRKTFPTIYLSLLCINIAYHVFC